MPNHIHRAGQFAFWRIRSYYVLKGIRYEKGRRRHKDFDENGGCGREFACNRICGALIGACPTPSIPPTKLRQLHVAPASHLPRRPRFRFCLSKVVLRCQSCRIPGGKEENAELQHGLRLREAEGNCCWKGCLRGVCNIGGSWPGTYLSLMTVGWKYKKLFTANRWKGERGEEGGHSNCGRVRGRPYTLVRLPGHQWWVILTFTFIFTLHSLSLSFSLCIHFHFHFYYTLVRLPRHQRWVILTFTFIFTLHSLSLSF